MLGITFNEEKVDFIFMKWLFKLGALSFIFFSSSTWGLKFLFYFNKKQQRVSKIQ